jgi:predicted RNase H-like nuclease
VRVIGVDGYRGGWVFATWTGYDLHLGVATHIGEVLELDADAVAIDMPIGLPRSGTRACDTAAKRLLGRAHSRVFMTPPRACLASLDDHAGAIALAREAGGCAPSAQAFGILRKIAEVDACVARRDERRVVEAHPELSFAALGGSVLPSKRTGAGVARRVQCLLSVRPTTLDALAALESVVPIDDALDALVLTWTVQRWRDGEAEPISAYERDPQTGVPMRIVV